MSCRFAPGSFVPPAGRRPPIFHPSQFEGIDLDYKVGNPEMSQAGLSQIPNFED